MSVLLSVLSVLGAVLLFLLKAVLIILAVVLVLLVLILLCPFCADVSWEDGVLKVKAGACGLTLPVFQYPKPEEPEAPPEPEPTDPWGKFKARLRAKRAARKEKKAAEKAAKKAAKEAEKKAKKESGEKRDIKKLAGQIFSVIGPLLRGAGRLLRAVFGALRFTKIHIYVPIGGGDDPATSARNYGKANVAMYSALGLLDRFFYLDFEELQLVPVVDPEAEPPAMRISFRLSARLIFIVITAIRVLFALWREKVLDVLIDFVVQ